MRKLDRAFALGASAVAVEMVSIASDAALGDAPRCATPGEGERADAASEGACAAAADASADSGATLRAGDRALPSFARGPRDAWTSAIFASSSELR